MSSFDNTMREWRRMCKSFRSQPNGCTGCPLSHVQCFHELPFSWPDNIEEIVMQWASEHPGPVYPTWGEWLVKQGIMTVVPSIRHEEDGVFVYTPLATIRDRIPADIAQKLGLEPLEPKED